MNLPAITIYQPYASLCVLPGEDGKAIKPDETRGWKRDSLRGQRIAIHSGAKYDLAGVQRHSHIFIENGWKWPLGALVGSAVVKDFWRVCVFDTPKLMFARWDTVERRFAEIREVPKARLPFGDFSPGRWAWELTEVERLVTPIPAKGQQGIWRLSDEQQAAYDRAEKVRVG